MRSSKLIITGMLIVLVLALACSKTDPGAPGETVVVEKEVVKTVEVPVEVVVEKEVVKTVEVPGETVIVEVIKEVQVPGETVVVEKEVVKTVEVPVEVVIQEGERVKEVQVPGETVVVEKEVVKTVEVPVEVVVVKEVMKGGTGPRRDRRYRERGRQDSRGRTGVGPGCSGVSGCCCPSRYSRPGRYSGSGRHVSAGAGRTVRSSSQERPAVHDDVQGLRAVPVRHHV